MKRILAMLLCMVLVLSLFAGCGGEEETQPTEGKHKHTYATDWSYDKDNHWLAATCGHDLKANTGAHLDEDKDGVCDACGWLDETHTHTFDTSWKSDETDHWHPALCGHLGAVSDKAAHADANNDGQCDVCAYMGEHTHTYEEGWSNNENEHWHAASCGHDVFAGKANHSDENLDGNCDVCGWFDASHSHTFSEEWTTDVVYHWHAATCEHSGAVMDKAEHADNDENGRCDSCQFLMCSHQDFDLDGECDICGYEDPSHTHEYSQMTSNAQGHWQVATCHPGATTAVEAHMDNNKDGNCDVCAFVVCSHTYEETWSSNETHHWKMVTCYCSIPRYGYGEHVDTDGKNGCDVCMYGFAIQSPFEVVYDKQKDMYQQEGKMINYYPVTLNIPQPGHYLIYSDNEQLRWCFTNDGNNVPTGYTLEFDATEAGELTLYVRYFNLNFSTDSAPFEFHYTLTRVDDLVLETNQGKAELPTNMIYKLILKGVALGTWSLKSSVDSLVMGTTESNMEYANSVDIEVTELGKDVELYVFLDDTSKSSFIFDWQLVAPFQLDVEMGDNAVSVPAKGDDYKIVFVAPEAGYYKLEVTNSWLTFCQWGLGGHNAPVRIENTEITTPYMEAGETFITWLQPMYNYPSANNINDTLTITNIGQLLAIDGGKIEVDASADGTTYSISVPAVNAGVIADVVYYNIVVTDGELGIVAAGNVQWTGSYEVKVKAGKTYTFKIRSTSGKAQVQITSHKYTMDLAEGSNTVHMIPNKEYNINWNNIDANRNVSLKWDNPGVIVKVNGEQYNPGAQIELLNTEISILVKSNAEVDVKIEVTILNPVEEQEYDSYVQLIATGVGVYVTAPGNGGYATAVFTAEEGGSFTLNCYTSNAQIYLVSSNGSEKLELSGVGAYTFTLNAGQSIEFRIRTSDDQKGNVMLSLVPGNGK